MLLSKASSCSCSCRSSCPRASLCIHEAYSMNLVSQQCACITSSPQQQAVQQHTRVQQHQPAPAVAVRPLLSCIANRPLIQETAALNLTAALDRTALLLPCCPPAGAGHLAHITGDAVFLVRQVGNNFAFASPG